jgi:NUMOD4 motif
MCEIIWKKIKGYEDYKISSNGEIMSYKRKNPKKLKIFTSKEGYSRIYIYNGKRKHFYLHKIMAEHFIPNPNNYEIVTHINDILSDNRKENLKWTNFSIINKGTNHKNINRKSLSDDDVRNIRDLYETNKYTQEEISNKYNLSRSYINDIINYRRKKNIK